MAAAFYDGAGTIRRVEMPVKLPQRDDVRVVENDIDNEFHGALPQRVIADLAAEEVAAFESAPVREFVSVLAWRRARARARRLVNRAD